MFLNKNHSTYYDVEKDYVIASPDYHKVSCSYSIYIECILFIYSVFGEVMLEPWIDGASLLQVFVNIHGPVQLKHFSQFTFFEIYKKNLRIYQIGFN